MPLENISHYKIIKKLGAGGMGEVYLAEDTKLRRKVALKLLPADLTKNADRLGRFEQEAQAASALNHPNILVIHEVGTDGETHFIATEFIEGETLRKHLNRTPMSIRETLDVATQVAGALSAAHKAGIIHRDVKPENIMIRPDGYVKVLDFGLAKLTQQHPVSTDTEAPTVAKAATDPGTVMGTVNYMSPEQARGKPVDARSDIFSLGIVIYEMAAGRSPFEAETISDMLSFILHKEPLPLGRYSPDVPAELERIVTKALAKDKEERYQSAKDLLIDLKRLKQKQEVEAELERSASPESISKQSIASASRGSAAAIATESAGRSDGTAIRTLSSAEYIVTGIKQHKKATAVAFILLLLGCVGIYFLVRPAASKDTSPAGPKVISSLAVLPFVNTSGNSDIEYLSDGMTETLINSLSQLPNLSVKARSTVFRYKGRDVEPQQVGSELNVQAVLSGRVAQRGEQLTLGLELVEAHTGNQIWGEQYNRKVIDLLALQREIARDVSNKLQVRLSGAEEQRLTKNYTANVEAYQLYLKGRFYWNKRTGDALKKSIEYFNQAIEKDPSYALAYAGLSDAYGLVPGYSAGTPQDSYPKAKEAAEKAIQLDDTLAEGHTALARILFIYDWNFTESDKEFRRALELNPNYATAHHWYGSGPLFAMGRFDEAIVAGKRAVELDPLSLIINADLGGTYAAAGQYDKAIEQLRRTIEMDQGFYYAHSMLGQTYAAKGSFPEAIAEYKRARELNDDPSILGLLGQAYAASGERDEALRTLEQMKEISKRRYVSAYDFALVYVGLGEKEQALQWLERSYQDRSFEVVYFKTDPPLEPLRDDPRFQDLLSRVGLPQ